MAISTRTRALGATILTAAMGLPGGFLISGCGGSDAPNGGATASRDGKSDTAAPADKPAENTNPVPPGPAEQTAANETAIDPQAVPKKDSPEWLLGQMIVLRGEQLPPGTTAQAAMARKTERNQKLVEMARDVIGQTQKDKSRETVFNGAVQVLCESRLDLATGGSADDARALQEEAESFYKRDSGSPAAEEAGWHLTRLAHTNARQAKNDPRRIQQFAIAARLFATRFPKSETKALPLLAAAGKTCELYHLDSEAINCFAMLQEKFSKTPQAQEANAILRRLELKGRKVKLFGETADGRFLKNGQLLGKPVLVVFWQSESDSFEEMLPRLKQAIRPYESSGLTVIGVCLDEEKAPMDAFIEKNGLRWTQLFYADSAKRHWDHPLAQYYGVHDVPSLWLVDRDGVAVDTHVTPDSLDGQLRYLIANEGSPDRQ